MNEIDNIVKLYMGLHHGDCWIGVNFKDALHDIDAPLAVKTAGANTNSIWQLVAHLVYWRTTVINRLNGNVNPPPFTDFRMPDEPAGQSWKQMLLDFETTYSLLRSTIKHFKEENLHKQSPKEGQTFYQLLQGSLQHDAYHLGQIMLIKKACKDH